MNNFDLNLNPTSLNNNKPSLNTNELLMLADATEFCSICFSERILIVIILNRTNTNCSGLTIQKKKVDKYYIYYKTYRKKSEIWPRRTLGRIWGHCADIWDISVFLSKIRLSRFLIQDETFWFSYPRWDFPVFLSKIRLSGFLIQNKTFWFSHAIKVFWVFSCKIRLFGFLMQDKTFPFSYPR